LFFRFHRNPLIRGNLLVNGVGDKPIKIVVVGEDGRVTLPREIRKVLRIEVGEKVLWTLEEDRAYLKKVSV